MKTTSVSFSVLGRIRQTGWHAAFNTTDIVALAVLVNDTVGGVERVRAALRFALNLRHVRVVVSCETAGVATRLVPGLGACSLDVVKLHDVASGAASHGISLGPGLVDIVDVHGVADVLGWRGLANLDLGQVVGGIQRIVTLSVRLELDDLGGGAADVVRLQVGLLLVEADVEGAGARPVDVPVRVDELRLVDLLGAVQLGSSA